MGPAPLSPPATPKPLVVSIQMGYGHLRAAEPLASALQVELLHMDHSPLADAAEQRHWERARGPYEALSRFSQRPLLGAPLRPLLDLLTFIPPLHPSRDLSKPTLAVRTLRRLAEAGVGGGIIRHMNESGAPLLTTFYAPAILANEGGCERIYCVVTDTDINRVWVPMDPGRSRIHYFAPSQRAVRRLQAYGVAPERILLSGFPLPTELLGGPELPILRANLASRLARLDPSGAFRDAHGEEAERLLGHSLPKADRPPLLTFAVGGAGAQAEMAPFFLPSLRDAITSGRLRLVLVAGIREKVARTFQKAIQSAGLQEQLGTGIRLLLEPDFPSYFRSFNAVLAQTDILWTKPSEMSFFAALGIPLIVAPPIGAHEHYNRRWLIENGAGLDQRDPRFAGEWLAEWLSDGALAAAAWSGFKRLPNLGTYRILETLGFPSAPALAARSS